ncbi:Acid-sensing ion channel 1 like protein [Argiope bruennichi]|uniref:Acid-sensing ion channel 1 like protein n=1 Tax=Argiope bruennichi TaxID=94029 RepID=A0A8T0FZZ1_ARGBR|nr:Acid-sensing ion channel 1 like protein [Argiope bruennichi]
MSNDLTNNKAHGLHASVTDYASEVFEESSVCAVSAILTNDSKPRKIFRSVVFVIFTVLFLYQCIAFLYYVLQRPSVAEIEILRPETFVSPAYTFCNFNPIKRSKFCAKYPNNCTKPNEKWCDKNPRFCGTPDTQILKEEVISIDDLEELFHLNHEAEDMVRLVDDEDYNPVGPLPRYPSEYNIAACFTYYDRVDSPQDPKTEKRTPLGTGISEIFTFDPQENELIYPEARAGIMFEVHSPFEAVNPFDTGYFMKPGHLYRITVKMTQEELQTECVNYTEVWLKNNKTGYRSQDACEQKCIGDIVMECLNCTDPLTLYPYPNENFCNPKIEGKNTEMCDYPEYIIAECIKGCKDDCVKTKFSYEIKESFLNRYSLSTEKNESRQIRVRIDFPDVDIQKTTHKPQFKVLEIFSFIGGFLAFWIGLSMVQVVEIFDCIFQIVKHFFIKRAARSEGTVA